MLFGKVPQNIGPNHLKRDDFLKHNTKIAKCLLNLGADTFAVIADGTYCYIQKSSNFYFQRVTYSGQKKRHLVKPFVICCTDGYIIDIFGLYPGRYRLNDTQKLVNTTQKSVNSTQKKNFLSK